MQISSRISSWQSTIAIRLVHSRVERDTSPVEQASCLQPFWNKAALVVLDLSRKPWNSTKVSSVSWVTVWHCLPIELSVLNTKVLSSSFFPIQTSSWNIVMASFRSSLVRYTGVLTGLEISLSRGSRSCSREANYLSPSGETCCHLQSKSYFLGTVDPFSCLIKMWPVELAAVFPVVCTGQGLCHAFWDFELQQCKMKPYLFLFFCFLFCFLFVFFFFWACDCSSEVSGTSVHNTKLLNNPNTLFVSKHSCPLVVVSHTCLALLRISKN